MSITKAEILWTRKCPLSCSYCNMNTGQANSKDIFFWRKGLDNLKALDCKFIAIYGAEPLSDFENLPLFVKAISDRSMDMTLITSTIDPQLYQKLIILHANGLRSLTCSYDILPLDKSSKAKSAKAIETLEWFRELGDVDNIAIVVTLTRTNYKLLRKAAAELTKKGIWTFFDIIHPDRGQPGSKCKGQADGLLFQPEDVPDLIHELEMLNEDNLMVHNSTNFIGYLKQNKDSIINFDWHCAKQESFPAWVTVDYDGMVYPCDDFQMPELAIPLTKLARKLKHNIKKWRRLTLANCKGCIWNTHYDAHEIKEGRLSITKYVHNGKV